ncbi:MAG: hypothetical protein JW909_13855 [Planctomycetes bacterium]|nr:hypothetical protein [Planctomycetota bacterium]
MTGSRKIEEALSSDGARQIPVVLCYEAIYYRDHWNLLSSLPWWYPQSPVVEHQVEYRSRMIQATPQDWFILPACLPLSKRQTLSVETDGDRAYLVDSATGEKTEYARTRVGGWRESGGRHSAGSDDVPSTPDDVDARILEQQGPPPEAAEGVGDLAKRLLHGAGADIYPFNHVHAPLWKTYGLWGFEEMMMKVASQPDLVKHAVERYLAHETARARLFASVGSRALWIEDCLMDMIGTDAYAELAEPYTRRLIEEIHALGMKAVHYFAGNPAGKLELIIGAGPDAVSFEESKKGFSIDVAEIVDAVNGRCAVLGNLDAVGVLEGASEEDLRSEIRRQVAAGRRNGSRFIMSIGSPVTPDTGVERVRRYCEMAREIGAA